MIGKMLGDGWGKKGGGTVVGDEKCLVCWVYKFGGRILRGKTRNWWIFGILLLNSNVTTFST